MPFPKPSPFSQPFCAALRFELKPWAIKPTTFLCNNLLLPTNQQIPFSFNTTLLILNYISINHNTG
jgi:hypothetical protein